MVLREETYSVRVWGCCAVGADCREAVYGHLGKARIHPRQVRGHLERAIRP